MTNDASETITVAPEDAGARLDRVLAARIPTLSRSRLKALILDGQVTIADPGAGRTILDPSAQVKSGDILTVNLPPPEEARPRAEAIPLTIAYEDDDLIVIDKPKGLVVHPSAGHATGTLVNALIAHCGDSLSGIGGVKRPGIVHRLDKDTTGLMVVAKNDRAHHGLSKQFADKLESELQRGYLAVVWGAPLRSNGLIDAALDRNPHSREKRAVRQDGRPAVTHWELRETYLAPDDIRLGKRAGKKAAEMPDGTAIGSLIACMLETGRTHQIRVHLAHIGHPIMGDEPYATGFKSKAGQLGPTTRAALDALGRQALHAAVLGFTHPTTGEFLRFESEPPADIQTLIDNLRAKA